MAILNEKKIVNDIRLLALDMIDNANSGHPGMVLSAAPIIYTLFAHHLKFDLEKCNICESYEFQEELIDTTEQGGIGYICENCIIDVE